MSKKSKITDIVFLAFFGYMILVCIYDFLYTGYLLSINTYLAILCWLLVVLLKTKKASSSQYLVLMLLIASIFNIISFSAEIISIGTNIYHRSLVGLNFYYPGINPFMVFLLIIYSCINRKGVYDAYHLVFSPSDKEAAITYKKKVDFYYQKFAEYDSEQLQKLAEDIEEYPFEAKAAIKKLTGEKALI